MDPGDNAPSLTIADASDAAAVAASFQHRQMSQDLTEPLFPGSGGTRLLPVIRLPDEEQRQAASSTQAVTLLTTTILLSKTILGAGALWIE